ncbi:nucleotide disphospho-sugar-binding domain-containing protein [Sphaerimonospora thailandensis]|uniref:Glycosyl transferase n=1 Tax=Sphaerimonospora thailandensis TaxID=795644 RepID=A0A8J3R839_9ACTN|nr:nucleotide disphospho-sugar-binding domain-containing protein [Sphaerimonospora thailandensis]GIH67783.1 glycosyl transferase [Sphaerimonospora thailandensis]
MRVMFTMFPSTAHFLPLVPYAWALQAAGHEVCVAAPPGVATGLAVPDFHRSVNGAGLTAVSCGEPQALAVHDRDHPGYAELIPSIEESENLVRAIALDPAERAPWDVFYHFALLTIRNYHPPVPRQDVEAVVEFAREWKPDLVLWDPWFPCGAVAARACGAAHARVLLAPDYTAWAAEKFAERGRSGDLDRDPPANPLVETVRPLAERYGFEVDDELLHGQWTVNPFVEGMRLPTGLPTVNSRYVPYTGASVMPEWLYRPPARPRVAISLGVSTRMFFKGDWGRTAKLMEAVAGLDVEVIATLNANQLLDVAAGIPGNVRTLDYVPLDQLLPTCSAIIHHGSIGTFVAASAKNVPQLICDTDEPCRIVGTPKDDGIDWDLQCQKQLTATRTSAYVTGRGGGVRLNHQTQSAEEMRGQLLRVLDDPSFREGAETIHQEWLAAPSPAGIVPVLEKLTAEHRG